MTRIEPPGGEREDEELPPRHEQVPRRLLPVQDAQLVARDRARELGTEAAGVLAEIVGFHGVEGDAPVPLSA